MSALRTITGRLELRGVLLLGLFGLGLLWLMYHAGLISLWIRSEEYGHGPLVLLVLGYLLYRRRQALPLAPESRVWVVALLAMLPLSLLVLGAVAGVTQLKMYAVWLFALAAVFALGGRVLLRKLSVPLLIAFMVIPLPNGAEVALTAQLQLVSSQLGVWFIRLFGGVVHLQGNLIDMGSIQLLVAEACAGLRYLYPLMSLGAIGGYLLQAPLWMRWALFFATVPITVFMNSFRIGVTGVLVHNWGLSHTEGFLHFFEGWVVFIAALLMLVLVAWCLLRLQPGTHSLAHAFSLDDPAGAVRAPAPPRGAPLRRLAPVTVALLLAGLLAPLLTLRTELLPERQPLSEFPVRLAEWTAQPHRLSPIVEAVAGASDYFYGDFSSPYSTGLNLYVSYYESQRHGKIPHSPKVCIPGDGWEIVSVEPITLVDADGASFQANRLKTTKGDSTVLAYYWLKQGPVMYRHELRARLNLLRSSVLERRTDGALIRLVTELRPGEDVAEVDQRLSGFATAVLGVLPAYVPD